MVCQNCGAPLNTGALFCSKRGQKIRKDNKKIKKILKIILAVLGIIAALFIVLFVKLIRDVKKESDMWDATHFPLISYFDE